MDFEAIIPSATFGDHMMTLPSLFPPVDGQFDILPRTLYLPPENPPRWSGSRSNTKSPILLDENLAAVEVIIPRTVIFNASRGPKAHPTAAIGRNMLVFSISSAILQQFSLLVVLAILAWPLGCLTQRGDPLAATSGRTKPVRSEVAQTSSRGPNRHQLMKNKLGNPAGRSLCCFCFDMPDFLTKPWLPLTKTTGNSKSGQHLRATHQL